MADTKTTDSADKAFAQASSEAVAKPSTAKPASELSATKSAAKPAAKSPPAKATTAKAKPAAPRRAAAKKKTTRTRRTSAPRPTAQKGPKPMNDTVKTMTKTAKKVTEDTKARVETLVADASAKTREAMEKTAKAAEDVTAFSKGNVEAIVESGKITAKGLKSIGEDTLEFSRKSFEDASSVAKKFAAVKTPAELFQLHGDYVRSSFDMLVAQTSKNSEAMVKLAGESFQPLSNRFAEAAAKIKTAA
jgi:phasin family protein